MKNLIILLLSALFYSHPSGLKGQDQLQKVEPPYWWTGMNNDTLHLLFYGNDIKIDAISCDKKDIIINNFKISNNGDYLFVDLILKDSSPGEITLNFNSKKKKQKWNYLLKERIKDSPYPQGLDQSDFIYLLMPDRFANGDTENDFFTTMKQPTINRDSLYERHGGDLKGILDHFDYIKELGVTALWLNPVETNDQELESYHGYAVTDHYKVDPRLGSNDSYKELVDLAHDNNIKMIRDVVFNHFGNNHPLTINPPDSSWINYWDEYTKTSYRASVRLDPHASQKDLERFDKGWFDHHMPDMNYKNKDLANYMIQNSIWWVEAFNLDAYRIDTYIYPDQNFMKLWGKAIKEEYPTLFLFAETWVHETSIQSWFVGGNKFDQGDTYLDGVTDFQLYYAINNALSQSQSWTQGSSQIYYKLVDDMAYVAPENNVLFLDNHDLDRFYGVVDQNFDKYKIGITLLFTLRGIPSMFYGTEILMPYKGEHGLLRADFPGGWKSDTLSKFTADHRTVLENEAYDFVQHLATWRKESEAIKNGKLIQFIPENGFYVFARVSENEVVLVIYNQNEYSIEIELSEYDEVLEGTRIYHSIIEDKSYSELEKVSILPKSIKVLSFNLKR